VLTTKQAIKQSLSPLKITCDEATGEELIATLHFDLSADEE